MNDRSRPILIADPDARARALIARLLASAGHDTSTATTGEEALEAVRCERPRLVVLDVRLSGLSGYEVCRELRDEYGEGLPILFVSGERTESYDRVAGLLVGADDYLTRPFAHDELLARVRALIRRTVPASAAANYNLTNRELEVLGLLAEGRKQSEIAERLVISPRTVGTHIEHVLSKLDVHSRAEAVALAYRKELVAPSGQTPRPVDHR